MGHILNATVVALDNGRPFTFGTKQRNIRALSLLYRPLSFAPSAKLVLSILHG